jgi:hypothetical protein
MGAAIGSGHVLDDALRDFRPLALDKDFIAVALVRD